MNKNIFYILGMIFSLYPSLVSAFDIEKGGIYYNINSDKTTVSVTEGPAKYEGNVIIPSSITFNGQDYPVVAIGEHAFYGCYDLLLSVEIPESITSIGNYAFAYCYNLSSITIPNSVTKIGSSLFDNCFALKEVNLSLQISSIPEGTFYVCKSLELINLPNSITYIGISAFGGCEKLKELTIPSAVQKIDFNAFSSCRGLTSFKLEDNENPLTLVWDDPWDYVRMTYCPIERLYIGRSLDYKEGYSPFEETTTIKELSLGKFVSRGQSVFPELNEGLVTINCYNPEPPLMNSFTDSQYENVIVNIPIGSLNAYKAHSIWGNFKNLNEVFENSTPDVLPEQVILNENDLQLSIGETFQLIAAILPADSSDQNITWKSSNENVASVSETGLVVALSDGSAIISAVCGDVAAECLVTVSQEIREPKQLYLVIEEAQLSIGDSFQINAVSDSNAFDPDFISFSSSNPSVVSIDNNGIVTAVSDGNAIITAYYGELSSSFKVNVTGYSDIDSLPLSSETSVSVYSLDGILINKNCKIKELNSLAKGVYIINSGAQSYKIAL